ncbi:MAG: hypothetical protein IPP32_03480 [Bacteroidetes bacterium]|nr:hypothetical protein [Bacteroidota bacterium]
MQVSQSTIRTAQLIPMVHVHSNNALTNTAYNSIFKTPTFLAADLTLLASIRKKMMELSQNIIEETGNNIFNYCRNASFVLKKKESAELVEKISSLQFVQSLVQRALDEVEIYHKNGINYVEIENVGAPYFIGNEIPLEDLLILHTVAQAIRKNYPELKMGIQVLSSGELEALPIAIACDAFFVRSEASLFKGLRPEGETSNRGNLAKFFYLRNYLQAAQGVEMPENRRTPQVWCDVQKKHTVFKEELTGLKTWLNTALFMKIEGLVLTGAETGSDIAEHDLREAKNSISNLHENVKHISGNTTEISIPIVTGSGSNIEMYKKYADFIILGTSLKKNNYWENEVDESRVKEMLKRFQP